MASTDDLSIAAVAAYEQGQFQDAARQLELANARVPNNPITLLQLCELYRRIGDWPKLAATARSAIELVRAADSTALLFLSEALATALFESRAVDALRDDYARIRSDLIAAIDGHAGAKSKVKIKNPLGLALRCAALAGDCGLAGHVLRKLHPSSLGIDLPVQISPVVDLKSWCRQYGVPIKEVSAPVRVNVAMDEFAWSYHADGYYLAAIPQGEMLCGWDYAVTHAGHVLSDSGALPIAEARGRWFPHHTCAPDVVVHSWPERTNYVDANVLFLTGPDGLAIGHWIEDYLPRLRDETLALFPDVKIAIPKQLPQKHRRFLSLFGVSERRLIECDFGTRYKFRNLAVAKYGWFVRRPHPDSVRFLSQKMRAPDLRAKRGTRIFLQRSAVATRQVANWVDVRPVLDEFGFELADLASLSVDEQRERIGGADIVISTYGSDLLALLFMQPGSDLIELRYDPYMDAVAGPMCAMTGVNYHILLTERADVSQVVIMKKDSDFVIDCDELFGLLNRIIERKEGDAFGGLKLKMHSELTSDVRSDEMLRRTYKGRERGELQK